MLNIFETGDESFRLADARDVNVGWVRGSAVGFDGFQTEADALAAALAGSGALAGFLERLTGAAQKPEAGAGRVRVAKGGAGSDGVGNDGAGNGAADGAAAGAGAAEWVVRGAARLARLYRPGAGSFERRGDTFGVEFVLPSYVRPGAAISAAQVIHKAIQARADIGKGVAKGASKGASKGAAKGATPLPFGGAREGALRGLAGEVTPADGAAAR